METPFIEHPVRLRGQKIELHPLEFSSLDTLFAVAQDPDIWRLTSVDYSVKENFYPNFTAALRGRESGKCYPFLICLAGTAQVIGTTRLLDLVPEDRKVEIGVTFLVTQFWGTGINAECKYLLLQYCFETLQLNRVQFRAKCDNLRSRRALEKIGATFEGIHRQDKIEPGGQARDTAFFSIIKNEWPGLQVRRAARVVKQET